MRQSGVCFISVQILLTREVKILCKAKNIKIICLIVFVSCLLSLRPTLPNLGQLNGHLDLYGDHH